MKGKIAIVLLLCYAIPCVMIQISYHSQLKTAMETGAWPYALELTRGQDPALHAKLLRIVSGNTLAAGEDGFYYITSDGRVVQVDFTGKCEFVSGLERIEAIYCTFDGYIDVITRDGEFLTNHLMQPEDAPLVPSSYETAGDDVMVGAGIGQWLSGAFCFSELRDGIAFGRTRYPSLGLFVYRDGTVTIISDGMDPENAMQYESQWEDVIQLAASGRDIVGLTKKGTVLYNHDSPHQAAYEQWDDLVAVYGDRRSNHVFGLRSDGRVVAAGKNVWGEGNVQDWENMVCIAPARTFTAGLRGDGTVAATGANDYGQCDTGDWKDIIGIAVAETYTLGIDRRGDVWLAGTVGGVEFSGKLLNGAAEAYVDAITIFT